MQTEVVFMVVAIDVDTDSWRVSGEFYGNSACRQWPVIEKIREQNKLYGNVTGRKDSLVTFGFGKVGNRKRCQGEVLFFMTKRSLYVAGYAIQDWQPIRHTITIHWPCNDC